jgi:polar amino acid transport system substrate-binding protein
MKKAFTVLALIFAAITLASAALAADTLEEVKKKGVLTVGVRDSSPPFSFLDKEKGQITGIEVDLVEAIAKKLAVPLKLVPVSAAERAEALHDGKVDLVAATYSKTPDRAKIVDFSLTYFKSKQRILAKKGVVSTLKDLEGKKIAVVKGTTTEKNLRQMVPSATVLPLSTMKYVIDVLARGEVDIVSGDGPVLYGYLMGAPPDKKDKFEIPKDLALAEENYGMAVRLGDRKFLDFVNGVLTDLKKSGEADKIFSKWLKGMPGAPGAPAPASAAVPPKDAKAEAPAPAPSAPKAGGAVVRRASAAGRFVVITLKGVFVDGADVTIYGMQGQVVCRGKVANVYGDDVYVDAIGDRSDEVAPGFGVGMGIPDEEAKTLVASRQEVLQNVKAESKKEADARQKEIATDYKADQAQRLEYQKEVQTTQTQMNYQYDDSWGSGYGGWGGGGYYRW